MVTGEGDEGDANAQRELNKPLLPLGASGVSRAAFEDDEVKLFPLLGVTPTFPLSLGMTAWAEEVGTGLLMLAPGLGVQTGS